MKRRCYLAGPMRHRSHGTVARTFLYAAGMLRTRGWDVLTPSVELTHSTDEDYVRIVERDLALVCSLRPPADAIVLLPGYELSLGATAELAVARWIGVRALLYNEALNDETEGLLL